MSSKQYADKGHQTNDEQDGAANDHQHVQIEEL